MFRIFREELSRGYPWLPVSLQYKYEVTQRPNSLIYSSTWEREHTNEIREKCVNLHKSGNVYNKLLNHLKIPISTIRESSNPLELLQTCMEEDTSLFCPHAQWVRRMVREEDHCWREVAEVAPERDHRRGDRGLLIYLLHILLCLIHKYKYYLSIDLLDLKSTCMFSPRSPHCKASSIILVKSKWPNTRCRVQ